MAQPVSGLAASIRQATESETFDLAGSNSSTIETTIRNAFSEPFALTEMIRLTFVTGAGKLGRSRYDEKAAQTVTSTLRELGFEDDRGASAVMECAGSFKLQHDTGKNLKTVVVFPKVTTTGATTTVDGAMNGLGLEGGSQDASILQEGSIEHKIAYTTMNVFPRMVENRCATWSQKKGCVAAIASLKGVAESLDAKLMKGQALTEVEQEFYDSVSMTTIEEKQNCLRDLMHKQVDDGKITSDERQQLLAQVSERLDTLAKDITTAESEKKMKRVENLKLAAAKAKARQEKLQETGTTPPPPLKNEPSIAKLQKELAPLLAVEEAAKGRLLSLKESQSVSRLEEIREEIAELEESSRGWFESDEAFNARVNASRTAYQNKRKQAAKKKTTGGAGKSALPATTKWVTPGASKQGAWKKPAKKKAPTGGGVFAAMMNGSDSD